MKLGSLCTGYGGLDLAVGAHFGAELIWVADHAPGPVALLAHHYPDVPNLGDLTAVDWAQIEPVDVLTAGYPCQPVSHAGKRKGVEDERHIWPWIATAIRHLRPRYVVLENVAGHRSMGFGAVLGDLAEARYDARWASVRACDVAAPHRRERVFILAADTESIRRGQGRPEPAGVERGLDSAECSSATTTDAGCVGGQRRGNPVDVAGPPRDCESETDQRQRNGNAAVHRRAATAEWNGYESAVTRWERTLGRSAPEPTGIGRTGKPQLAPSFVEWMMGLPAGWVTRVPELSRIQQLRLLGNGVVPQQASLALRMLDSRQVGL